MADFYYRVAYEIMMVKNQEYPRAVQYLKLAETIAPNDARILHALGTALYRGGDQVQGTQYLERAYQLDPALRPK
jgi:Flp pilus assembly protein TadD